MRFLIALTALWAICAGPARAADDLAAMNAVSKAWDRWAETSSKNDPASVDSLSAESYRHFEFLRDAALYASSEQLRRLPSLDRMVVYGLRARKSPDDLAAADGKAIARMCIQLDLCGISRQAQEAGRTSLSNVTIVADRAIGEVAPPNGERFHFGPEFVSESGVWKLNYVSTVADASAWVDAQTAQTGEKPDDRISAILAAQLGSQGPVPPLALLDRAPLDEPERRIRLNETWPDYQATNKQRFAAIRKKAEEGDTLAQFAVGVLEYGGTQPEWAAKNEANGLKMLERASEGGHAGSAAMMLNALMSDRSKIGPATYAQALPHARRAAESGNAEAMAFLASYYFNGAAGVQRDCRQAAEWQARAEEAGLAAGRNELIWTYATCPIPEQRDPARALQLAQHLIEKKDKLERYELDTLAATFAANGDFARAVEYQELAISKLTKEDLNGTRKGMQARLKQYRKDRDFVQDFNSLELTDGY